MSVALVQRSEPAKSLARQSSDWARLLLIGNVIALLAVAIALRCWRIDNLPGLNGDEAWSGVQAMRLVSGQSFSWRTPTGNPVNPFYLGPLAALHLWLAPSIAVLRLPALFSGLAALGINFWLCRRVFGTRVACLSTLLLAVLPLNIAYSRFGWDASQTLLATTFVLYLGLELVPGDRAARRSLLRPALAFGAAILVHPTNVFTLWLLIAPVGYRYRAELAARWHQVRLRRGFWPLCCGLASAASVAAFAGIPLVRSAVARAVDPTQWGIFFRLLTRLFSGSTTYEYIVGPATGSTAIGGLEWIIVALALAAGLGFARLLQHRDAERERALALGSLGVAVSFFLVAGPAAIAPHFERYGVCLIAPGALLLARGLDYWLAAEQPRARQALVGLCLLAWLGLDLFVARYFLPIERSGGESHLAFRTSDIEPKQAAWNLIAQHSGARPITIVCDGWWLYWPLAYLSAERRDVRFVEADALPSAALAGESALWFVAFSGTPAAEGVDARLAEHCLVGRKTVIGDSSGRPLLVVVQAEDKTAGNY
jgi:hypothetical protein